MIIYPTLEILNGKCATLTRGRLEEPVLWHVDPVATARGFAAAGAEWMHLTDLNGLLVDGGDNAALIEEIIRSVGIPVQLGGGFRTRSAVTHWIDRGAGRITVGTMAVHYPDLVKELAKFHPDQIVLAVDVFEDQVMVDGWCTASALHPEDLIAAFEEAPLAGIIITDVDADIADQEVRLGVISRLAQHTRHSVIARGTVRNVDDVARLRYIPGITGTLIGRALLSKDVDLVEAIKVARPSHEPTAAFQ